MGKPHILVFLNVKLNKILQEYKKKSTKSGNKEELRKSASYEKMRRRKQENIQIKTTWQRTTEGEETFIRTWKNKIFVLLGIR